MEDSIKGLLIEKNELICQMKNKLENEFDKCISEKFEFNYVKTLRPYNGEGKKQKNKIISGQIILFDFIRNQISIIDKKIYEGHFNKTKEYGPFPFERLGFYKDNIFLIKLLSYIKKLNISIDSYLDIPKYIIANRRKINSESITEKDTSNLLLLWQIDDSNYKYEKYISIYDKLTEISITLFKRMKHINYEYERLWKKYEYTCSKIESLN